MNGLIVDLFAGGGGASTGLAWAMACHSRAWAAHPTPEQEAPHA